MDCFKELFRRYQENPILSPENWPYKVAAVFNPGATKFNDEVLLLVRVEDKQGYSHLTNARSRNGKTDWQISSLPTLKADSDFGEAVFGLEDPRIIWLEERQEYLIICVSFFEGVAGEPPGISLIATRDFSSFKRLGRQLIPPNKDACLFPRTFNGRYALIHRPIVEGRGDIWVSFSSRDDDLNFWGQDRVLISARHRSWDGDRIGLGPPPIETDEGWLIIYHGTRRTASGSIYRIGLALLDLETLKVIYRTKNWVFGPKKDYERVGEVDNIVFPCGTILNKETKELFMYYGAADSVISLAIASLEDVLLYLKENSE